MPVHDWSRATAGTFHDFHVAWIAELRRALNGGLLPEGYYALAEQVANQVIADVLTLQDVRQTERNARSPGGTVPEENGGVAVATLPPRVSVCETLDEPPAL